MCSLIEIMTELRTFRCVEYVKTGWEHGANETGQSAHRKTD